MLSESSSSSDSDSSSDSSASESESETDGTKFQVIGNLPMPNSSTRNLVCSSNSPVAHLSMPSHLLSEDLRLSDSGSDSE